MDQCAGLFSDRIGKCGMGVSQSVNGRVSNTSNLSEYWVGYSSRYGDSVDDFAPLLGFKVQGTKTIFAELEAP